MMIKDGNTNDIWHLFQQLLGALEGKIDRALVLIV
jgi:hypothetical protein